MIKDSVQLNKEFHPYEMGRIDTIVNEKIYSHGLEKGVVKLTAPEGVFFTTIEFESGLVEDFIDAYRYFDEHVKPSTDKAILAKMPKNEIIIPFNLGRLVIGDWQQIVFFILETMGSMEIGMEITPSNSILGVESVYTGGELQIHDITDIVERTLANTKNANITIVCPDTNVILYHLNPSLHRDFIDFLVKSAPKDRHYRHSHEWAQSIGYIHVRASFISQILSLRVVNGKIDLGDERVFMTEMDAVGTKRDLYFEVWN